MTQTWNVCIESGCPELTDSRSKRCPAHRLSRSPSSKATSSPGWKRLRAEVLARDTVCQVQLPGCEGNATVVDHREGLAYGGSSSADNLQGACQSCNNGKRGSPPLKRELR
jgi:5-methylcytosine-specific restriction endonuclease McrA